MNDLASQPPAPEPRAAASPAATLVQTHLDRLAAATLARDWPAYRGGISLPFTLVTGSAHLEIAGEDQLRRGFDEFTAMLEGLRVTHYVRLIEAAEETDPGTIEGTYLTHLLAGTHRVTPPYASRMTIREAGGAWRAVRIVTELVNARWPIAIPLPPPDRDAG